MVIHHITHPIPSSAEIHLWQIPLIATPNAVDQLSLLLNTEEQNRANRFHFAIHRERFTIAHAALRQILSYYLNQDPKALLFARTINGKPYLPNNSLTFNLSHSHDQAVLGVTQNNFVGIDIEKMELSYNDAVAERFFSTTEYQKLHELSSEQQVEAFYYLWAHKEALIKALSHGLTFPLSSFSVPLNQQKKYVTINDASWYLESFIAHPHYQAAFATQQAIEKITRLEWNPLNVT